MPASTSSTVKVEELIVTAEGETLSPVMEEHNQHLIALTLAPLYLKRDRKINAAPMQDAVNAAIDKTDVGYHTFLRLWEVFENVWLNQSSSDRDNPNSSFNHVTQAHPEIAAASVLPILIGFGIHWHQVKNKRERLTMEHQQKMAGLLYAVDDQTQLKTMQDLLKRGKVTLPLEQQLKEPDPSGLQKTSGRIGKAIAKRAPRFVAALKKIRSGLYGTWNYLVQSALIFWPAWMISVLVVGFNASYAFPVLPLVILATLVVSAAIHFGFMWLKKKRKQSVHSDECTQAEEEALKKAAEKKATNQALLNRAKNKQQLKTDKEAAQHFVPRLMQRANMKLRQKEFNQAFARYQPAAAKNPITTEAVSDFTVGMMKADHVMLLVKNNDAPAVRPTAEKELSLDEMTKALRKTEIGQRVVNGRHARNLHYVVTATQATINGYTLASFVWWVLGAALLALSFVTGLAPALAGLTAVLSLLGNTILGSILPAITAVAGALYGLFTGKKATDLLAQEEKRFIQTAYAALNKKYAVNNRDWVLAINQDLVTKQRLTQAEVGTHEATCQEAFDYFYAQVEQKKKDIACLLQAKQQQLKTKIGPDSEQEALIRKINLKEIDAYNNRYFRTQEQSQTIWTTFKKIAYRFYKLINSAQTWIFVTRSLFLTGAAIGMFCLLFGPASPFVFIGIAVSMAISGLIVRGTQLYLDKKMVDQKHFIETLDDRISYLKKQYKQLEMAENYLKEDQASSTKQVLHQLPSNNATAKAPIVNATNKIGPTRFQAAMPGAPVAQPALKQQEAPRVRFA